MLRRNARQLRRDFVRRLSSLPGYDLDDALEVVGLRRAPKPMARFFSGMGLVMGGVMAGVVLGMIFLPRRRELREKLGQVSQTATSTLRGSMPGVRSEMSHSQHR